MKKVLSLLLVFVFLQTQSWALSGGPNYSGSGTAASLVGTYSGVLTGPVNALGIFVVGIQEVGPAQGDFSVFIGGIFYGGQIIGIADPQESTFQGVLDAQRVSQSSFVVDPFFFGTSGSSTVQGIASGLVDATIEETGGVNAGLAGTRMTGTAHIDAREFDPGTTTTITPPAGGTGTATTTTTGGTFVLVESLDFVVDGFKQSAEGNFQQAQVLQGFGASSGTATP